jgi:hypothetical protein
VFTVVIEIEFDLPTFFPILAPPCAFFFFLPFLSYFFQYFAHSFTNVELKVLNFNLKVFKI